MNKLYRVKPVDKKSIYQVYDIYKQLPDGTIRGFVVRELYRWGQGFREMDEPIFLEDKWVIVDPNIGWGCELDDGISIDFEFDDTFTEEEKEEIEDIWCNGDPEDPDMRCGAAWLYDYSDWLVEDDYVEILGPFKVDIIDGSSYTTVLEENIKLESRAAAKPNAWPF